MRTLALFTTIILLFTGCAKEVVYKEKYLYTPCPIFNAKLKLDLYEINDTMYGIDEQGLQSLLEFKKEKEKFNYKVQKLNEQNEKKSKEQ